jgi:hypothetical protein
VKADVKFGQENNNLGILVVSIHTVYMPVKSSLMVKSWLKLPSYVYNYGTLKKL